MEIAVGREGLQCGGGRRWRKEKLCLALWMGVPNLLLHRTALTISLSILEGLISVSSSNLEDSSLAASTTVQPEEQRRGKSERTRLQTELRPRELNRKA